MRKRHASKVSFPILLIASCSLAAIAACSSSSTGTGDSGGGMPNATVSGTAGAGGASSSTAGPSATGSTTSGSGGSTGGTGGSGVGGGGQDASAPPADGGSTCSGETPAGSAACGAASSCHLASCGPPLAFGCTPAGAVASGGACKLSTECGAGLTCVGYTATLSACEKQCVVEADCPNSHCLGYSICGQTPGGGFCARACTDVTMAGAAACGTGFKCDAFCSGATVSTLCLPAGTLRSGTCMGVACAAGYVCVNRNVDGGAVPSCMQYCKTNADCMTGTCTGNLSCGGVANGLHFCQ